MARKDEGADPELRRWFVSLEPESPDVIVVGMGMHVYRLTPDQAEEMARHLLGAACDIRLRRAHWPGSEDGSNR